MVTSARADVLERLAGILRDRARARPTDVLRVAVTGITASGKSTFALELVERIRAGGTAGVRLGVDGFHQARAIRWRRGRESAEGYYRDAYDYPLLRRCVLEPLAPGGTGWYVPRGFDLDTDAPVEVPREHAPPGTIVVLDASFLLRPEVRDCFDYRIFLHASFEVAEARGVGRDAAALGSIEAATRLYRTRYHEAQRLYFREARPLEHADAIVLHDEVDAPVLFTRDACA